MKPDPPALPQQIAPNLWTLDYPLRLLGFHIGRRVTLVRLPSDDLLIHSTAPFDRDAVTAIRSLGRPIALVEGTLFHDTFALKGRAAFPDVPYFAPRATDPWNAGARPLSELAVTAGNAVSLAPLAGIPAAQEHILVHPASRSAIACDLIFNLQPPKPAWTAFGFKALNGCYGRPGMTRLYRRMIRDRAAFRASLLALIEGHAFDRLIPGHGSIVPSGAKDILRRELNRLSPRRTHPR